MSSLQAGVTDGQLCWSLAKKPPKNLDDKGSDSNAVNNLKADPKPVDKKRSEPADQAPNSVDPKKKKFGKEQAYRHPYKTFEYYTPLNTSMMEILEVIKNDRNLRRSPKSLGKGRNKDRSRCCHFHRGYGHETEECKYLKGEIEDLIRRGYYGNFVRDAGRGPAPARRDQGLPPSPPRNPQPNNCRADAGDNQNAAQRDDRDPNGGPAAPRQWVGAIQFGSIESSSRAGKEWVSVKERLGGRQHIQSGSIPS